MPNSSAPTAPPPLDPTDPAAVRAWLADHAPDIAAVQAWSVRLLARLGPSRSVPTLGSPAWQELADTDPRKLAAALAPAVEHLRYWTTDAVAGRLRVELDEFATAIRRALAEIAADVSRGWADGGYSVGPSHAELVRRRNSHTCPECRAQLHYRDSQCAGCGWDETTPEGRQARALSIGSAGGPKALHRMGRADPRAARTDTRMATPFGEQGAA